MTGLCLKYVRFAPQFTHEKTSDADVDDAAGRRPPHCHASIVHKRLNFSPAIWVLFCVAGVNLLDSFFFVAGVNLLDRP